MTWKKVKVFLAKHIWLEMTWTKSESVFGKTHLVKKTWEKVKVFLAKHIWREMSWKKVKVFLAKHILWEMSWKNDQRSVFTTNAAKTSG